MKTIAFVVPYFGHFPSYFDIWLNSCKHNPTVNWFIFTDCMDVHPYPPNVKVVKTTFEELRERFQAHFDFRISLEKPYKLCDYKPAYGDLFYDYIKDYDFWGYCDIDLVWGDIRKFITDDLLGQYDKIGNRGHCCLLRNTEKMRKAFRYESDSIVTHRDAFSSELAYCFDEQMAFGRYCKESGVKTCENFTFFDVSCNHDDYRVSAYEAGLFEYNAHNVFLYDGESLYLLWLKRGADLMHRKEILYAHFQKRAMQVNINEAEYDKFLVYKDSFNSYKKDLNAEDIKQCDPKSIKKTLWLNIMWKKIKAEILHLGGVKFYKYE